MNEVDEHLLTLIESSDPEGWRLFVDRFRRRLIAFANRRVSSYALAEDLVQETFLSFLSSRSTYRGDGDLESYLFQILRRRIIDHYRRRGVLAEVPACDVGHSESDDAIASATSEEPSASWYLRREEEHQQVSLAFSDAVRRLANYLHEGERFKELKVAEGCFFARQRNSDLAAKLDISSNEVAVIKRRLIARMRDDLIAAQDGSRLPDDVDLASDLLSRVWEASRPSCPKRSTLGKFTLGILPDNWNDYVRFHVQTLGCLYCAANLEELESGSGAAEADESRDRLFQSTIGFLISEDT